MEHLMSPELFKLLEQLHETEEDKCIPVFKKIMDHANRLEDIDDRIEYLEGELKSYLQFLPFSIANVSGQAIKNGVPGPFFLDRLLRIEIEFLKSKGKRPTLGDRLKARLSQYNFFDLPMVKAMKNPELLLTLFAEKNLPYNIAMSEYIGFIKEIEVNYAETKEKRNKILSEIFGSDIRGRNVRGNIAVLSPRTEEDRTRFTAHKYKEMVKKDYKELK